MTTVIFVTQLIDPSDPILGFVVPVVRALHRQGAQVVVIANEVRRIDGDPFAFESPEGIEVVSLLKEKGRGRVRRAIRYQRQLGRLARRTGHPIVLAHMCPIYLGAAAPLLRVTGCSSLLWFTNAADSRKLRWAERVADVVLTALPGSYPRPVAKLRAIGHSIDTDRFAYTDPDTGAAPVRLLAVGRTAPVKNYPTMIEAVATARERNIDVRLRIVGPATTGDERAHRVELRELIADLRLDGAVTIEDPVAPEIVPALLGECTALVNATAASADKVVFEAMSCGRPTLVTSLAFDPLIADLPLALRFSQSRPEELTSRLEELTAAVPQVRLEMARTLRRRVEESHSLEHWATEVLEIAQGLQARTRSGRRPRDAGADSATRKSVG